MDNYIKMVDLKNQYLKIKDEINKAIFDVIDSTQFIQGKFVKEFENNVSKYIGCDHSIGCASGTDALQIALMALDVKPGDEIITTPFTFVATTETIALLGAVPVYVDINEKTYNIDVNRIEAKITDRTKAILPVHLYGQPCEMDAIMKLSKKYNIKVIEDAAQAFGAVYKDKKVCNIGHIGCISFFPSKNLGAYGDGGMVTTNDPELNEKMRMIAAHGSKKRYYHDILGINSRLDTIQAAILNVKLKYIDEYHEARIKAAEYYNVKLSEAVIKPFVIDNVKHIFHQYSIRYNKRDKLKQHLEDNNIPSMIYYPVPLHLQKAYKYNYKEGDYSISEDISKDILSLPIHTEMDENQLNYICNTINEFIRSN